MGGRGVCAHGRLTDGWCSECYRESLTFPEPATHDDLLVILERVEAKLDRLLAQTGEATARPQPHFMGIPMEIQSVEDNAEDRNTWTEAEIAQMLKILPPDLTPDRGTPCSDADPQP